MPKTNTVNIEVPKINKAEGQEAGNLVCTLQQMYGISNDHMDLLFNGMLSVYVMSKIIDKEAN